MHEMLTCICYSAFMPHNVARINCPSRCDRISAQGKTIFTFILRKKYPFKVAMDFGKTGGMSVATKLDEIRRRSMETMSNIPLNLYNSTHKYPFDVHFMSISCQFYAKSLYEFAKFSMNKGLIRPPSLLLSNVKKNCRIGAALHPLIIREKLII